MAVAMGGRATVTNCVLYNCDWALGPQSGGHLELSNCVVKGLNFQVCP